MTERKAPGDVRDRVADEGDPAATRLDDRALAPSTLDTYRAAVRRFDEWLSGRVATDDALADYLDTLFDRGLAPAYASVAVAAVAHRARRDRTPVVVGERTARALAAFRRDGAGRGPGQAVGVRWEQADRMAALAEAKGDAAGLRDALFVRIASDCLLRVGEAAALDVADVFFENDGLAVLVRRSKTDRHGRGSSHYAGPPAARLLRRWLAAAGIEEGPLFRPVDKAGRDRSSARGTRSVKHRQAASGRGGSRGARFRAFVPGGRCAVAARRRRHDVRTDDGGALTVAWRRWPATRGCRTRPPGRWRGCATASSRPTGGRPARTRADRRGCADERFAGRSEPRRRRCAGGRRRDDC